MKRHSPPTLGSVARDNVGSLLLRCQSEVVYGQAFTRLVTFTLPRPVVKSQPFCDG